MTAEINGERRTRLANLRVDPVLAVALAGRLIEAAPPRLGSRTG